MTIKEDTQLHKKEKKKKSNGLKKRSIKVFVLQNKNKMM